MTRLEAVARELATISGDQFAAARVYWLAQAEGVLAIADTHPKDGDVEQAPLVSGGGAEGNRPETSMTTLSSHKYSMKGYSGE